MSNDGVTRDYWPTDEWKSIKPLKVGVNPNKLKEINYMIESQYKNINGIIIIKSGYKVFERYYNGFNELDTHNVASVTKSVLSALIGITVDKGNIKNINEKVVTFFPEYFKDICDIEKSKITIKHLLTMTAPFMWKTIGWSYEPLNRLRMQKDWVKYILKLIGRNGMIGKFQYCTAGTHLLSAILTKVIGTCAREFANKYLFKPIGINEIPDYNMNSFSIDDVFGKNVTGWVKDPKGNTLGGWGLTITLRDMARFGFLYLNHGRWDEKQIVSEKWVKDSVTINSNNYGYLWWLWNNKNAFMYSALGAGGSGIWCIPESDLLVSITSKIVMKPRDRKLLIEKINNLFLA